MFDRADNTYSICEIKYQQQAPGMELIPAMEKRLASLNAPKTKAIQKVLITLTPPSKELLKSGYFQRVILAADLLA